jgi:hypothetical protein
MNTAMSNSKLIFLLPAVFLLVVTNVYAGGPRADWQICSGTVQYPIDLKSYFTSLISLC